MDRMASGALNIQWLTFFNLQVVSGCPRLRDESNGCSGVHHHVPLGDGCLIRIPLRFFNAGRDGNLNMRLLDGGWRGGHGFGR